MQSRTANAPTSQRSYRPDIDGLRAIAVLSVIVFHLSARVVPGGFVGVDIFFVISGYLITSHIVDELDQRHFSIKGFYARRIKRIAPAMLVVTALTLAFAKAFMLPDDAADAAKSGVYSLASMANVFFWRYQDTGYFAAQGKDLPLLHLWSLGVEEQFYILWPLLLLAFYRAHRAKGFLIAMLVAAAISFGLGSALYGTHPQFTYYMLPTRAGELLVGAVATSAIVTAWTKALPRWALTAIAVVGLLGIAGSLAFLREDDVFPGVLAIPPTVGTALLILAGRDASGAVTRLLSLKPLTWIGLISYSAYLWHWPLVTFHRYWFTVLTPAAAVAIFVATIGLAWLSYRFVEQPARHAKLSFPSLLLQQYVLPGGAIGAFALFMVYADRYVPALRSTQYRARLAAVQDQDRPAYEYPYVCQRQRLSPADVADPNCVVGDATANDTNILLWGDSNAGHYVGLLGVFGREAGFKFRNVEVGACPPLLSDPKPFVDPRRENDCSASLAMVRPLLDTARTVIIGAAWTGYQLRARGFDSAFFDTVRELVRRGKQIIIIGAIPRLEGFDRRCRQKILALPIVDCAVIRGPIPSDVAQFNQELRAFAEQMTDVTYYDANAYLCPNGVCSTSAQDGNVLYYDPGHLTMTGSRLLGESIVRAAGVPHPFSDLSSAPSANNAPTLTVSR